MIKLMKKFGPRNKICDRYILFKLQYIALDYTVALVAKYLTTNNTFSLHKYEAWLKRHVGGDINILRKKVNMLEGECERINSQAENLE